MNERGFIPKGAEEFSFKKKFSDLDRDQENNKIEDEKTSLLEMIKDKYDSLPVEEQNEIGREIQLIAEEKNRNNGKVESMNKYPKYFGILVGRAEESNKKVGEGIDKMLAEKQGK